MAMKTFYCRSNTMAVTLVLIIGGCAQQRTEGPSLSVVFTIPPGFSDTVNFTVTNTNPNCTTSLGQPHVSIYPDLSQSCRMTLFDVTANVTVNAVAVIVPSLSTNYFTLSCEDTFSFSTATILAPFYACAQLNTHVYQVIVTCLQADQTVFSAASPDLTCN